MPVKIKYNSRGDPTAVKIDKDDWIEKDKGTWNGYFEQIIKRALKYDDVANRKDKIK